MFPVGTCFPKSNFGYYSWEVKLDHIICPQLHMLYIVIVVDVATTIPEKNPLFVGVVNAIGVIVAAK